MRLILQAFLYLVLIIGSLIVMMGLAVCMLCEIGLEKVNGTKTFEE